MEFTEKDFIKPDLCHVTEMENLKPIFRFEKGMNWKEHKAKLREKYLELLGRMPERIPTNVKIEWEKEHDTFMEKRFIFDSEEYSKVPCHLWVPKDGKEKHAVIICLQGHATGMHISMGRPIYPGDEEDCKSGDRDFAVQVIREGYAALVMDQRGFGERKTDKTEIEGADTTCPHPSMLAILLGRTLIGERVWDISRAIDALEEFPEIDTDRVAVMGNSGGGTASYYAACFDERIKIAMPSCSVCTYRHSITASRHCDCNYIPRAALYFDMGDLAALIAPRKLIVVAGEKDRSFQIRGVEETFDIIRGLYEEEGAPENCKLIKGPEGHRFYADLSWGVFNGFNL